MTYVKDNRSKKKKAYMFMKLTLPLLYAMHSDIFPSILWCLFCFRGVVFKADYNPLQLFHSPEPLGLSAWLPGSVASSSNSYTSLQCLLGANRD